MLVVALAPDRRTTIRPSIAWFDGGGNGYTNDRIAAQNPRLLEFRWSANRREQARAEPLTSRVAPSVAAKGR